jgi:TPR repeat protein/serine/threonine protein kinase
VKKDIESFNYIVSRFLAINKHMALTVQETKALKGDSDLMKKELNKKVPLNGSSSAAGSSSSIGFSSHASVISSNSGSSSGSSRRSHHSSHSGHSSHHSHHLTPKNSSESLLGGDETSVSSAGSSMNSNDLISVNDIVIDRILAGKLLYGEPLTAEQASKRMKMLSKLRLQPEDILVSSIQLGQGGFGDVFLGNYKRSNKCAIKTVSNIEDPSSESKRRNVENEILLMKYLGSYRTILPCYGFAIENNNLHIVLQYAPYGSLDKLLKEKQLEDFPLALVLGWLTDLSDALNFLHQRDIMHRDMKAENMLLFERLSIKLCDFGPAKHHLSTVTADDNSGTICFTAPEIRVGQCTELSADIFTFGMVALQIINRTNPKIDNFKMQIIEALMKLKISNANVNRKLHNLLTSCVAYDSNISPGSLRPTAQDVLLSLKDIVENEMGGDPRSSESHPLARTMKDIEEVAYMRQTERLKALGQKANPSGTTSIPARGKGGSLFRSGSGKKNLKSFSHDQYDNPNSFLKATEHVSSRVDGPNFSTYSAYSRTEKNGETTTYSCAFTKSLGPMSPLGAPPVVPGGPPNMSSYMDAQSSDEKNQMVKFLRNEVHFTLSNAIRVAEILTRNGVINISVLRRRLIRNKDFLLDIGVDDDSHYEILEHMINTAKDNDEIENLRSSKRYSQRLAAKQQNNMDMSAKLPTETSRLYYEASQCNRSEALMALKDLSEQGDKLAAAYLMRMLALGQGGMLKDHKKAQEMGKTLFTWLQEVVARGSDLLVMFARFLIGVCYSEGLGIRQDIREAIRWYKLSASQGYSTAQAVLGQCYFTGTGIPRNLEEALRYYKLGAELGHAGAQCNLGLCYENGYGIAKDKETAVKCYRNAADQGDAAALYNLGFCYERGFGVAENIREAVKCYKGASGAGYTAAQHNLGLCYYFGNGVDQNIEEAVVWLRLSAEKGYAPAQCKLGLCYENGHGVNQDFKEAVYWYRQSAEQGDAAALYYLGFCFFSGTGVEVSYEDAVRYYKESATKNYPPALNNLGFCYFNGMGLPKNYTMAVKYYRQSAELGYAPAQYNMAYCYEKGYGVVKKLNTVIKWYRLAAENGNEKAKRELAKYQAF